MNRKLVFLSNSTIKIFAILFMIIDHVGMILLEDTSLYLPFRIIGRLAFPLFAYLAVEGILHTHNKLLYCSRLIILGGLLSLIQLAFTHEYSGNIFPTLGFSCLAIYFFEKDKWYYKLIGILPAVYVTLCGYNFFFFKCDYNLYGLVTILAFYGAYKLTKVYVPYYCTKNNIDLEMMEMTEFPIFLRNMISVIFFITVNFIFYFTIGWQGIFLPYIDMWVQIYSIFSAFFILLYNGKRGYNKPWFKWTCYAMYPLSFVITYLISFII